MGGDIKRVSYESKCCRWTLLLIGTSLERGLPGGASGKEPACQCRRHKRRAFDPWVGKIPWRKAWQPTPIFLPGESHGQRRVAGYRVGRDWSDLAHNLRSIKGAFREASDLRRAQNAYELNISENVRKVGIHLVRICISVQRYWT